MPKCDCGSTFVSLFDCLLGFISYRYKSITPPVPPSVPWNLPNPLQYVPGIQRMQVTDAVAPVHAHGRKVMSFSHIIML